MRVEGFPTITHLHLSAVSYLYFSLCKRWKDRGKINCVAGPLILYGLVLYGLIP